LITAFTATVTGALIGALLLVLMAPWIAQWYGKPQLASLLRVAAIAIPISACAAVIAGNLRRQMAFAPLARRTVIGRIVGTLIGLVVAWYGGGAWSLIAMYVCSILLSTIVLMSNRYLPGWGFDNSAFKELWRFGGPNMASQVLLLGNGRLFVSVAGMYLGDAALGVFSLAFRIVEELRNTLSSAAAQLALPLLAKRAHLEEQFANVFSEATRFTAMVLLPFYAGIMLVSPDLIQVLFGPKWQDASTATTLLAAAALIVTFRQYSSIAISATGRPEINLLINGIALAFSIGALLTGYVTDAGSAARIWLWRAVILLVASLVGTRFATPLTIKSQVVPTSVPLVATLVMCLCVSLLRSADTPLEGSPVWLTVNVLTAVISYAAALFAISPQLVVQLYSFSRNAVMSRATSH
jgi:PST family polysaccharide transporter